MPAMKISEYSALYKALSEPVRLRILYLLLEKGELCVCDLVEALALSQSVVSRHLATLRNGGLLLARREGVWIYYQIDNSSRFVTELLEQFKTEARQSSDFIEDIKRIETLACNSCS